MPAKQLQVVNRGGAVQGHGDDVIALKIKLLPTLGALTAVSLEHQSLTSHLRAGMSVGLSPRGEVDSVNNEQHEQDNRYDNH